MYSNVMNIVSIFIIFFVQNSFYYANSQTFPHFGETFNNATTNESISSDTMTNESISSDTMTNESISSNMSETEDIFSNCTKFFELFTEKVTNLTRCTLLNARPIRVCMNCRNEMTDANKSFENLNEDQLCKEFYFESDQVGITNIIYNEVLNLWLKNNCENCYNTKQTEDFFKKSREFDSCMKLHNDTIIGINNTCHACLDVYMQMNGIYKAFVKSMTEDDLNICMDIIDQMNITRHTWSRLDCLKFNSNVGFPIIITSVIVGIVPVLFYLLSKNISIIEDVKLVRPKRKSYASLQDSLPKE